MARDAGSARMRPGQWEPGGFMTERRSRPGGRVVAGRTLPWVARLRMVRIRCAIVIGEMTGVAVRWQPRVYVIFMAHSAGYARVRAGIRKRGCAVIEGRVRPACGCVAGRTLPRKSRLSMVWIGCIVVFLVMTRLAGRRQSHICAVCMARGA